MNELASLRPSRRVHRPDSPDATERVDLKRIAKAIRLW
jgi:hypothetical protein